MTKRDAFKLPLGVVALLLLLPVTAGCQASPSPGSLPTEAPPATLPQLTPTPEPTMPAIDQALAHGAEPVVANARADLAQRLGVPEDQIAVVAVEAVEWSDGSLGCPSPGMSYIQVLTPGFRVTLQAEGAEYDYHTDTRQAMVLCDEARQDLAGRLSIPVDQIEVFSARSIVWPDNSLGCPQPGMAYKQVPQEGVLIRLSVSGNIYNYHGGGSRDPFLCQHKFKDIEPPPSLGND